MSPDIESLVEGLRSPDWAQCQEALVAFSLDAEGLVHAPGALQGPMYRRLDLLRSDIRHDRRYEWLARTDEEWTGWIGSEPYDARRFCPPGDGPVFAHLIWKPQRGLWSAPFLDGSRTLWSEYLLRRQAIGSRRLRATVRSGGGPALHLPNLEAFDALQTVVRAGDGVNWSELGLKYEAVHFSWCLVLEGIIAQLLDPTRVPPALGIGVASTLWLRQPHAEEVGR